MRSIWLKTKIFLKKHWKKLLAGVLLVLLLASALLLLICYRTYVRYHDIETVELLPHDIAFAIRLSNAEKNWRELRDSKTYKQLSTSPRARRFAESQIVLSLLGGHSVSSLKNDLQKVAASAPLSLFSESNIMGLAGKDIIAAGKLGPNFSVSDVIILTRINFKFNILLMLARHFGPTFSSFISIEKYEGFPLTILSSRPDSLSIFTIHLGDIVALTTRRQWAESLIRRANSFRRNRFPRIPECSLPAEKVSRDVANALSRRDVPLMGYLDLKAIRNLGPVYRDIESSLDSFPLSELFPLLQLDALTDISWCVSYKGNSLNFRAIAGIDRQRLTGLGMQISQPPFTLPSLENVSQRVLSGTYGGIEVSAIWDWLGTLSHRQCLDFAEGIRKELIFYHRELTGILEEAGILGLIDDLGRNISFALRRAERYNPEKAVLESFPAIVFISQLPQGSSDDLLPRMNQLLLEFFRGQVSEFRLREASLSGTLYYTIDILSGPAASVTAYVQPSYGVVGEFFVFSTTEELFVDAANQILRYEFPPRQEQASPPTTELPVLTLQLNIHEFAKMLHRMRESIAAVRVEQIDQRALRMKLRQEKLLKMRQEGRTITDHEAFETFLDTAVREHIEREKKEIAQRIEDFAQDVWLLESADVSFRYEDDKLVIDFGVMLDLD